jgi:hypothetical protein
MIAFRVLMDGSSVGAQQATLIRQICCSKDLNRVLDKPLVAPVESNGREDSIVAQESWEAYLKRNQSQIVDLFQGQLKSTVRFACCQQCASLQSVCTTILTCSTCSLRC